MLLFLFQIPNKIGKFDFYFSFEHILNMCWIRFFYLPIFSIGFIKIMEKNNVKLWNPPNLQCSDIFNEYISHSKLGHFLYFSLRFFFAIFLVLWIIQAKSVWSTFFLSLGDFESVRKLFKSVINVIKIYYSSLKMFESIKSPEAKWWWHFFCLRWWFFFAFCLCVCFSFSPTQDNVQDNAKYFQLNDKIRANKSKSSIQNIYKICK